MEVTLFLNFTSKDVRSKKKIEKDLYWYDRSESDPLKRMKKFRGGRLEFKYDYEKHKQVVSVVDDYISIHEKKNNEQSIKKWISSIGRSLDIEINKEESSNKGIAIDIDKNNLSAAEYSLERHGIDFEKV